MNRPVIFIVLIVGVIGIVVAGIITLSNKVNTTTPQEAESRIWRTIRYDNHLFIRYNYESILHHPDCPCKSKSE